MTTVITKITSDLEQFYAEVLKDPSLQERLKAATDLENLSALAVEMGKEKGYSFSKEEVLTAIATEPAIKGEYLEVGDSWNSNDIVAIGGFPPGSKSYG